MSDYSNSYGGAAKDSANDTILGADIDTQLDAAAVASATKANKIPSATNGNVVTMDANGDLLDGVVDSTEIAILDGATLTTTELNILDGVTSTTAELNKLDGVTSTTAELNYTDGVTSNIQTQFDALTLLTTKVIDIGDWNMQTVTSTSVNIPHGLTLSKIRTIIVMIRNDTATASAVQMSSVPDGSSSRITVGASNVTLTVINGDHFDNSVYNTATSFNRGWITIQYTD